MTASEVWQEVKAGICAAPAMGMVASGMLAGWAIAFAILVINLVTGNRAGWDYAMLVDHARDMPGGRLVLVLEVGRHIAVPLAVVVAGELAGRRGSWQWALIGALTANFWVAIRPSPPAPFTDVELYYLLWVVTASLLATLGYHVRVRLPVPYGSMRQSGPQRPNTQQERSQSDALWGMIGRVIIFILGWLVIWVIESITSQLP